MSEKTKVVINNTGRTFHTSKGELSNGKSHELPEKEADSLLDYSGMVDAATVVPAAVPANVKKLEEENEHLRAKIKELEATVEKVTEELHEANKKK